MLPDEDPALAWPVAGSGYAVPGTAYFSSSRSLEDRQVDVLPRILLEIRQHRIRLRHQPPQVAVEQGVLEQLAGVAVAAFDAGHEVVGALARRVEVGGDARQARARRLEVLHR